MPQAPESFPLILPDAMKAWVCPRYGGPDVLQIEARPLPLLKPDTVLIRMRATTVSAADARIRAARFPRGFGILGRLALGITGPRKAVLGTDVSGTVLAVGGDVKAFKLGDDVVSFPGVSLGCHAGFVAVSQKMPIAMKPENLSHEEAVSLCFGGMTALDYIRKAELKAGEALLVIGATGAVGQAFVQLAHAMGADVSAVCRTENIALARELGAKHVFDYTRDDFCAGGRRWDVIADLSGIHNLAGCMQVMNRNGRFLALAGPISDLFTRRRGSRRQLAGPASERPEYLTELMRIAAEGKLKPVIDSTFGFADLAQAHSRSDTGHKRGSVVVRGL